VSPKLPDLLMGLAVSLTSPAPPEAGGDYAAGRTGLVAMLLMLASQEAERGPAARIWENAAIAELLGDSSPPPDGAWSALDARNAELRRALIDLHIAAENRGDRDLQRRILALYEAMADARRLELPGGG
jgi:hypothetical protein